MEPRSPIPRRPILLAMTLAGTITSLGLACWGVGGVAAVHLVPLTGYAAFLGWFGTGLALASGHPAFRWFLVSTLAATAGMAAFALGWAAMPEAMYRSLPTVGGLLLVVLGICAAIGCLAAAIGWWSWCRRLRVGRA